MQGKKMTSGELESISLSDIKNEKQITSLDELKVFLSNNLLLYLQFDLPREFNLVDVSKLAYNHRFMRNFSRSYSFEQSKEYMRKNLHEFFQVEQVKQQSAMHVTKEKKLIKFSYKQVFFNIGDVSDNKIIIEDTTNFDLGDASTKSLEDVITDIQQNEKSLVSHQNEEMNINLRSSSELSNINPPNDLQKHQEIKIEGQEILDLMKNFSINLTVPKISQDEVSTSNEDKLNEAFDILGIGNIKKTLGKTIITKKKKEGLFFDEWVNENFQWVQYLIKKLTHVDYLSLKEESNYLSLVRNYKYSTQFDSIISKLYSDLQLDSKDE